jgi:hypothetical protein
MMSFRLAKAPRAPRLTAPRHCPRIGRVKVCFRAYALDAVDAGGKAAEMPPGLTGVLSGGLSRPYKPRGPSTALFVSVSGAV